MLKIMLKISQVLILFHTSHSAFSIKRCVFLKTGHFPFSKVGFNLTIPNIRLIFAGLTLMTLKEFRL